MRKTNFPNVKFQLDTQVSFNYYTLLCLKDQFAWRQNFKLWHSADKLENVRLATIVKVDISNAFCNGRKKDHKEKKEARKVVVDDQKRHEADVQNK